MPRILTEIIKIGDIIWQSRQPGGYCLVLDVLELIGDEPDMGWLPQDYPIYVVMHPTEGVIEDASYYYNTLEEQDRLESRVWKEGKVIGHLTDGKLIPLTEDYIARYREGYEE